MDLNLAQAKIGAQLQVTGIDSTQAEVSERLYALGVFPGVELHLLRRAPLGDPLQIKAGHTLISIRHQEAQSIQVKPMAGSSSPGLN